MRLSLARSSLLALSLAVLGVAAGCTVGREEPDAGGLDAPSTDAARDVPAVSCATAAECNDDIPCTFDDCIVGNVCDHMPLDTLCEDGERCDLTRGCTAGCTTVADCNVDRNYCDGMYACNAGTCVPSLARNCNDGNECTVDSCDPAAMGGVGGCVYALASGCDGGVGAGDAGMPVCDPFVPATGYTGVFRMAPVLSLDCLENYTISSMTFSVSGGMLRVTGAPSFGATLTGPVPSGATFTVSGSTSCGDYTLTGTFACANRFSGMFTSSFSSECSICGGGTTTVVGRI